MNDGLPKFTNFVENNKRTDMKRIVALFLACLLLAADFIQAQEVVKESQWKGKKVAFLGDSITDKRRIGTRKCYWEYLAEWLGLEALSYGINGNQMNGLLRQAEKLKAEQGDSIDAIILFAGTNDYNGSIPLGEWYNEERVEVEAAAGKPVSKQWRRHRTPAMNDSTLCGRINRLMDYLKKNFPDKQVIVLTPLHRAYAKFGETNVQPDEQYANRIGLFLEDYTRIIKQTADVWAVPVIDLGALSGLYPVEENHLMYFAESVTGRPDRLHPNAEGHRRMALTLMYQLLALPAGF